jgi:phosphate transport system substrate-binding protein
MPSFFNAHGALACRWRNMSLIAVASVAAYIQAAPADSKPRTPAEFVTQAVTNGEPGKAYSGSAVERRGRLAARARQTYEHEFDLSGLPAYAPKSKVAGQIRIWGNNYIGDSGLSRRIEEAFRKHHPAATLEWVLPSAAVAVPGLYFGLADIGMNHEPTFYDYLGHVRILGYEPTGFSVVTGSYDVSGWQNTMAIIVHKDNPLSKITLEQLDGVFGSTRAGGWLGTQWHPEFARGPEKDVRTWDQLGVRGPLAGKRIKPHGYSVRYATALEFSNRILHGSDKWNGDLLAYGNYVSPDGKRALQAEQILEQVTTDPQAIAYIRWQKGFEGKVKVLAVAKDASGPYYDFTVENVQSRRYPLWGDQLFWVSVKPGTKIDAKTAELIRFMLSREGQQLVMEDGKYLPLPADAAREELAKLAKIE